MLAFSRTSALKRLAPRMITSARGSADIAPAGASLWTTPKALDSDPHAWEREKLRLQLENDATMQVVGQAYSERVRLAKVWGWTGAFVFCFTLKTVENIHQQHLQSQQEMQAAPSTTRHY